MTLDEMIRRLEDSIMPQLEEIRVDLEAMVPKGAGRGEPSFETFHSFGGTVGIMMRATQRLRELRRLQNVAQGR